MRHGRVALSQPTSPAARSNTSGSRQSLRRVDAHVAAVELQVAVRLVKVKLPDTPAAPGHASLAAMPKR